MQVELRDLAKSYGSRLVFRGVTATLSTGRVVAITGPSGSGKSTLLGIVSGLISPDKGSVRVVVGTRSTHPDPQLVAWVPQMSSSLPSRTTLDNVIIGSLAQGLDLSLSRALGMGLLADMGLAGLADQPAATLSGGELQRVCLCRALAAGRPMILADEPTANLDEDASLLVRDSLGRIAGTGVCVVVATHDPTFVEVADDVVSLR